MDPFAMRVGSIVRKYYEDDAYDQGLISDIHNGVVTVDFYDWLEQWPEDRLIVDNCPWIWSDDSYVPMGPGTIIHQFGHGGHC